ncbi:hypothetical protein PsorP6_010531 [Peronosclerospora sorghi]|uniref:Uncharacterized protein n=1 Tax=Peronosclerospora sorghi TaxID=230839 RepID=A0ACC0VUQ4_9STRA|nr:hypothetical protein PsorP6_010531 [Peronosclerospora sorghi]
MIHKNMDRRCWAEVMDAVVHVINLIPTTARPDHSPFELCFKKRPSLGHLQITKGYIVWNKDMNKLEVVRSVVLQEVEPQRYVHVLPGNKGPGMSRNDDDDVFVMQPTASGAAQPMDVDDEGPNLNSQLTVTPPVPEQQVHPPVPEPTRVTDVAPETAMEFSPSSMVFHPRVQRLGRQPVAVLPAPEENRLVAVGKI